MKLNEHPSCGCIACRRGAGTAAGQDEHRRVARKLRRKWREALRQVRGPDDDAGPLVVRTNYTD